MKRCLILLPLALLAAAAPTATTEDLVRRGNEAFEARDYSRAIELYEQAEVHATDPGLIAMNKAAAFYQQAQIARGAQQRQWFHRAEQQYRCALEGAEEPRRLRASFGLAGSLSQGRPDNVASLTRAIACYRECLASPALDEPLAANVRHNLEIAKLLLLRAREKPGQQEKPPDESGSDNPPKGKQPDDQNPQTPRQGDNPRQGEKKPGGNEVPVESKDGKKQQPESQRVADKGTEPVLDDNTPSPSLDPADAARALDDAHEKIQALRKGNRMRSSRRIPGAVKDW
jgi:hypothetical protein